ncbi:MAG: hypothetical protein O2971_03665 [Proteobacteria bacterium]|nr:hypothetical protein [Pseudomonadota bacterium]
MSHAGTIIGIPGLEIERVKRREGIGLGEALLAGGRLESIAVALMPRYSTPPDDPSPAHTP